MHKTVSIMSAIALAGMTSLLAMGPALADDNGFGSSHPNMTSPQGQPQVQSQQQFVGNWCDRHSDDPSCQDFRVHHRHWGNAQYQGWYHNHQNDNGFDPLAAGIFGFAAGAIIAGAAANSDNEVVYGDDHVAACQEAYRSYEFRSDTYLGYDGYRHQCQL